MAGCTCPCSCGAAAARVGLRSRGWERGDPLAHSFIPGTTGRGTACIYQFGLRLEISQNAGPAANPVADFYLQFCIRVQQDIGAGTEFNQPHSLTALQSIAHLRMKNDSPRQQSSDLLKDD